MKSAFAIIAGLLILASFAACSQDKIEEFRITQEQKANGYLPDPLAFDTEITFCRFQSSKSGKFIGAGELFGVYEGSRVRAYVEMKNLGPDRTHSIHISWLRPGDRKELFRKYVEISLEQTETGWRKTLLWKEAEDLTHFDEEIQEGPDPHVLLDASMTTDPERERDLGEYTLRIYFNRELLTESTFTLIGSETSFTGPLDGDAFLMNEDASVDASVRLLGLEPGREYEAELAWHKPDGKKLFSKDLSVTAAADSSGVLEASMDISKSKKRAPGEYELKMYLDGSLVGQETFKLKKP